MRQIIEYLPSVLLLALIATVAAAIVKKLIHKPKLTQLLRFSIVTFLSAAYVFMACRILFNVTKFGIYGDIEPWHGNYIPFATIWEYISRGHIAMFLLQVAGNLLVTFPLPLVVWHYIPKQSIKSVCFISLIITALIEPVQLLINMILGGPSNIIDVDDLILNLAGCVLGLLLAVVVNRLLKGRQNHAGTCTICHAK